jgi:hypothetical protein
MYVSYVMAFVEQLTTGWVQAVSLVEKSFSSRILV